MNIVYRGFTTVILIMFVLNFVPVPQQVQWGLLFLAGILTGFTILYIIFNGDESE